MTLGVWSRSVGESAKLIPHSGGDYGPGTSRLRHDHARRPNCDTAIEGSAQGTSGAVWLNHKTVAKWRKRAFVNDAPMGPKTPHSTVLSSKEEAIIVAFRKHTLLPLDDCLYLCLAGDDPASDR